MKWNISGNITGNVKRFLLDSADLNVFGMRPSAPRLLGFLLKFCEVGVFLCWQIAQKCVFMCCNGSKTAFWLEDWHSESIWKNRATKIPIIKWNIFAKQTSNFFGLWMLNFVYKKKHKAEKMLLVNIKQSLSWTPETLHWKRWRRFGNPHKKYHPVREKFTVWTRWKFTWKEQVHVCVTQRKILQSHF